MYPRGFLEKALHSIRESLEFGFGNDSKFRILYFVYNQNSKSVILDYVAEEQTISSYDNRTEIKIDDGSKKGYLVCRCIKNINTCEESDPSKIKYSKRRNSSYIRNYIIAKPIKKGREVLGALLIDSNMDMRDVFEKNPNRSLKKTIDKLVIQFEIVAKLISQNKELDEKFLKNGTNSLEKIQVNKTEEKSSTIIHTQINGGSVGSVAHTVENGGKQEATINNTIHEKAKTLAEAADEIQKLLKQLNIELPNASREEKIVHVDNKIASTLKQRVIEVAKAGGRSVIEEFFDNNSYLKITMDVIDAWTKTVE